MGLENGIYIKPKTHRAKEYLRDSWSDLDIIKLSDESKAFEIAYFRRYWGLRHDVLEALDMTEGEINDIDLCGEHPVDRVQFTRIYDALCINISKDYYEEHNGYWDYYIAAKNLGVAIWTVGSMIEDFDSLDLWDEVELGFYDSP